MIILVAGGSGFLGERLVDNLKSAGHKVICLVNKRNGSISGVDYVNSIVEIKIKVDAVINCATIYDDSDVDEMIMCNVVLTANLLNYVKKYDVKKFVNVGTYFELYNKKNKYMKGYRATKKIANEIMKLYGASKTCSYINARLYHLYGKNDKKTKFTAWLFEKIASNSDVELTMGEQVRDFVEVNDAASIIRTIVESSKIPNGYTTIDVGTGIGTTIKEFATTCKFVLSSKSKIKFGAIKYREHEMMRAIANTKSYKKYELFDQFEVLEKKLKGVLCVQ